MEGKVVVRHGFLEFVEDPPPRRCRALTDSAMDTMNSDFDKEFPTHPLAHIVTPVSGKAIQIISEVSTETAVSETAESAPLTARSAAEDGASSLDAMPQAEAEADEDLDQALLPMPTPEMGPMSEDQAPMMDGYYFMPTYYDPSSFMGLYPPPLFDGSMDMLPGAELPFEEQMQYFQAAASAPCPEMMQAVPVETVQCCDGAGMMAQEHEASGCPETRTTAMLRNLPAEYNRAMLLELLDTEGFAALYDFVYLPMDFRSNVCFGYGFVNFVTPVAADCFRQHFDGFCRWSVHSSKVAEVSWSDPLQGLEAHVERYRDSPLMHEMVPDMYKPVLLSDGVRIVFPPPTKKLKAPRVRHAKGAADSALED